MAEQFEQRLAAMKDLLEEQADCTNAERKTGEIARLKEENERLTKVAEDAIIVAERLGDRRAPPCEHPGPVKRPRTEEVPAPAVVDTVARPFQQLARDAGVAAGVVARPSQQSTINAGSDAPPSQQSTINAGRDAPPSPQQPARDAGASVGALKNRYEALFH
ncbi:hypothetical protein BC832DRAFT_591780 [Gaertneriomyces semiglobifer]|nr:hypothetical protein BC832DRAFT_591780 [Gaertneriomyces semiglobifer]